MSSFWSGQPGKFEQLSRLSPGQQPIQNQLQNSVSGRGAGGAFGQAGDYYRDLLSDNPADLEAFAAPELRRFNEMTLPGLAQQYAGMGFGGGQGGSNFITDVNRSRTDLAERLGAIRAGLRQQGAQGLFQLGQQGLQPTVENLYRERGPGLVDALPQIAGAVTSAAVGNPLGGALGLVGDKGLDFLKNKTNLSGRAGLSAQIPKNPAQDYLSKNRGQMQLPKTGLGF